MAAAPRNFADTKRRLIERSAFGGVLVEANRSPKNETENLFFSNEKLCKPALYWRVERAALFAKTNTMISQFLCGQSRDIAEL